MNIGNNVIALGFALMVAAFAALPASARQNKPNVVFILADNVGYGDLGPYGGGEPATPFSVIRLRIAREHDGTVRHIETIRERLVRLVIG